MPHHHRDISLRNQEWRTWTELKLKITGLPPQVGTLSIYELLCRYGEILRIDLLEDIRGQRTGTAFIVFAPPPQIAFWLNRQQFRFVDDGRIYTLTITAEDKPRSFVFRSPVENRLFRERMELTAASLDFGFMLEEEKMMVMHTVDCATASIKFLVDLLRRRIEINFSMSLDVDAAPDHLQQFKIIIPHQQLSELWKADKSFKDIELVLHLDGPPEFFRRTLDMDACHGDGRTWHERSAWFRQTDIISKGKISKKAPITLRKDGPLIDIGRWTTYKLTFRKLQVNMWLFDNIQAAFQDYNLHTIEKPQFETVSKACETVWKWIDLPPDSSNSLFLGDISILPFDVRYQLEVCISQGFLNEYNITQEFIKQLAAATDSLARLEAVVTSQVRIFDVMTVFQMDVPFTRRREIPGHCIRLKTANITPSTVYYNTPSVEMTNRVLRRFQEHSDRFLRVRFSDERFYGRLTGSDDDTKNAILTRIKRCLANGIMIGDRHYEFLAFGNSQFREHGAYFFASTPQVTADDIRAWMGDFQEVKEISKYTARIGQCFSTTRAIHGSKVDIIPIPDVLTSGTNKSYNFTDGVGKISKFLAQIIASELRLPNASNDPPSVFQFRLAGYKGVVAIDPQAKFRELHLRPSQRKFESPSKGLEIIRYSSFATATLNRQLIVILKCLGVEDQVFLDKLEDALANLKSAMTDKTLALSMLQRQVDPNQMTLEISSMIVDGFLDAQEPFVVSLLHLWHAWSTKALKEKANIIVDQSAFVLGCTDETRTLQGYTSQQSKDMELPEIFLQISDLTTGRYKVIEGVCIVARNPSLYAGDIRVVRAVNKSELHHIKNAVVFPQSGDRDLPNMCSGGDLDGDDFFISWDRSLVPEESLWHQPAADFDGGPKAAKVDRPITVDDMTSFFVNYIKNDQLGRIAQAFLANADYLQDGALHPRCVELAELHSMAVDYPKSGIPAKMSRRLYPPKYPHFLESKFRAKEKIYHSETVLGQMYDRVDRIDFHPLLHLQFDSRILNAHKPTSQHLLDATTLKRQYDAAMRRIMAQHEIETEFEVWSTFVLKHARLTKEYTFHEEMGRISTSLREEYGNYCVEKAGSRDFDMLAPFIVAMYTVTSAEVETAVRRFREDHEIDDNEILEIRKKDMPLLSFPWIFHRELGALARGDTFSARPRTQITYAAPNDNKLPVEDGCESGNEQKDAADAADSSGGCKGGDKPEDLATDGEECISSAMAKLDWLLNA